MKRALALAKQGLFTTGVNPRVGCVIVKDDTIIGEGFHKITGSPHAEVNALENANQENANMPAKGATAYVSLEPCCHHGLTPPCTQSLIAAGISRVVICNADPNPLVAAQGIETLRAAGIKTTHSILAKKGQKLNLGFFKRMQTGLPYVRVKLAQSLDGRTAMKSGESYWITGKKARQDVQYWRARSHAIITGIGTVLQDDCRMSVRPEELPKKYKSLPHHFDTTQPMRVILDTHLRISPNAKILQSVGRCVVMTSLSLDNTKARTLQKHGIEIITLPLEPDKLDMDKSLDLEAALLWLGKEQINEVLVESGAVLAGKFVAQKLVDELLIYTAPVLMGSEARPLLDIQIETMKHRIHLNTVKFKQLGKDWRITARL